jgi:hypothetical protein
MHEALSACLPASNAARVDAAWRATRATLRSAYQRVLCVAWEVLVDEAAKVSLHGKIFGGCGAICTCSCKSTGLVGGGAGAEP